MEPQLVHVGVGDGVDRVQTTLCVHDPDLTVHMQYICVPAYGVLCWEEWAPIGVEEDVCHSPCPICAGQTKHTTCHAV